MFKCYFPRLKDLRVDEDRDDYFWADPAVWRIKNPFLFKF